MVELFLTSTKNVQRLIKIYTVSEARCSGLLEIVTSHVLKKTHDQQQRIVITGGGTGGHLFPGIAVAEAMLDRFPNSTILFIGTDRQIDSLALRNKSFKTTTIRCQGLKGKGLVSQVQTLLQLPLSVFEAIRLLRDFKADLVFGVGGYVTGPVLLAAGLLRIPGCIHEQNSIPGLANRLAGKIAKRIFVSIPGSENYFSRAKCIVSGNPVRKELLEASEISREIKADHTNILLILGGSQGARQVNKLVLEAIEHVRHDLPKDFMVIHQTGSHDEIKVKDCYAKFGINARVEAFFEKMAEIYQLAGLVVSRAGATTLAELTVLKKPSILIPFPYAADNHQEKNGQFLVEEGGAKMFVEKDLTGAQLGNEIIALLTNKKTLSEMAEKMSHHAKPKAVEVIVDECEKLINLQTSMG